MNAVTPILPIDPTDNDEKKPLKSPAAAAPSMAWQTPTSKPEQESPLGQNGAASDEDPAAIGRRTNMWGYTDAETIKRDVRALILRPDEYNVFTFYKNQDSCFWSRLAQRPEFENVTLGVIVGNAVWIAVDTDWNKETTLTSYSPLFQVMEHLFCTYFSVEWLVRFMAFKRKADCRKDGWFVFDSTLVFMMVVETWVFTLIGFITGETSESPLGDAAALRLFRLLRLSRLLRMLKSLPELMILVKGIKEAMRSVAAVMCLLGIILYVFAIAFTQLAVDKEVIREAYFQNVALAMYSLLIYGTFLDDLSQFCDDIRAESIPCLCLLGIFICLSALTVMNMLIGVLCEVVSGVAATENEMNTVRDASQTMQGIMGKLDNDGNQKITLEEFRGILVLPKALKALEKVGVDPVGVVDFAELMFFEDSDPSKPRELPFADFMEMILDLRSTNTAKVKDIKYMWRQLNPKLMHLTKDLEQLDGRTERVEQTMDAVLAEVKKLVVRHGADAAQGMVHPPSPGR